MKRITVILVLLASIVAATALEGAERRRRMTPLDTPATTTQSVNETANDTSRINARRRANSVTYQNEKGQTVYIDTISGEEWMDSTLISRVPKMEFPLWHAMTVGVNVWDPIMRAFGQHYGLADAFIELSLHNRYKPVLDLGLGLAENTPSGQNFTYRSPLSFYFKIGANYNFLFNSNPDYSFYAMFRYGFSPFSYSIDNVTVNSPYWGEEARFNIPSQHATAGWLEFGVGLRVKLVGPLSAGWAVRYQSMVHQSKNKYGDPWYIPGFGSKGSNFTASFALTYTFGLSRANKPKADGVVVNEPENASGTTAPDDVSGAEPPNITQE